MPDKDNAKPGYWRAMFQLKCPRCRRGEMFINPNPYKKFSLNYVLAMYQRCPVCGQVYELETGFWYGTGYVSYGLTVGFSVFTFLTWWLFIGFSLHDDRLLYWLITNGVLNIVLQPFFMRVSRWLFLNFFVRYNERWDSEEGVTFS